MLGLSWGDYQDFKAQQTVFDDVTAWTFFRQACTANGYAETGFGAVRAVEDKVVVEALEVVRWDGTLIGAKLARALSGRDVTART